MIKYNNISVEYDKSVVLSIRNLSFNSNTIYGIIGRNGSGKSTLVKSTLNLIPFKGDISIDKYDNRKNQDWKKITGSYIGEEQMIHFLTPREYLEFISKIRNIPLSEHHILFDDLLDFQPYAFLEEKKKIKQHSKGNIQKIGILGSLIGFPKVWLLDEPFAHLDKPSCDNLIQFFKEYKKNNLVLVVDHNIDYLFSFCDKIIVLNNGKIDSILEQQQFAANETKLMELINA